MLERLTVRAVSGPHSAQPVSVVEPENDARGAIVLLHGRHATAEGMMPLAKALKLSDWILAAPQAKDGTWYPRSFMASIEDNEPYLSSALDLVSATVESLTERVPAHRIAVLGFSQGACLALEYAARTNVVLGGAVGLSGGLIGPPGIEFDYRHTRAGLRVFLGCSDVDPHIPVERVKETETVFEDLGADVTKKIYPGMGHTISADELEESWKLLRAVAVPNT